MTPDEMRLECLRLAKRDSLTPQQVVEAARHFSDFVAGKADAKIVAAAHRAAAILSPAAAEP